MSTSTFTTFDRRVFAVAVVVYLCAAWFSTGFHAADEHYQVIAFAEAKLGNQPLDEMPWEFDARIRSAFLPTLCIGVFKVSSAVGLNDPFAMSFLLRFITALFALYAIRRFVGALRHNLLPAQWKPFLLLSFFLWFLPFIGVRFAGETWSGLFILLALAALISPKPRTARYFQCGLFLGLAFLCRPPTLFMALGIVLWLVLVKRERARSILYLVLGIAVMMLAGIALDSWYYNEPTITAWNYLRQGITGTGDQRFISYAWWYYPAWLIKYTIPPFGLAILAAFATLLAFRPKHILVWVIVPILLLHLALAHKDLRFLYPIAFLLPVLLVQAWSVWVERKVLKPTPSRTIMFILGAVVVINLLALLVVITSPAGSGRTRLAALVRSRYSGEAVRLNYVADSTTVWDIRIPCFYLPPTASDTLIDAPCSPMSRISGTIELLVTDQPGTACNGLDGRTWTVVGSAIPPGKQFALKWYEWEDRKPVWKLYESRPKGMPHLPSAP